VEVTSLTWWLGPGTKTRSSRVQLGLSLEFLSLMRMVKTVTFY